MKYTREFDGEVKGNFDGEVKGDSVVVSARVVIRDTNTSWNEPAASSGGHIRGNNPVVETSEGQSSLTGKKSDFKDTGGMGVNSIVMGDVSSTSISFSFTFDMPLDLPKPPDPLLEEFSALTGLRGVNNRFKGMNVKVQSPGSASAGAGAILKKIRSSKMVGKGRSRSESSPCDVLCGKRSNLSPVPVDDVLSKVLDRIAYDKSISDQMVFKEGVSDSGLDKGNKSGNKDFCAISGNDGTFIKMPCEPVVSANIKEDNNIMENKESSGDFIVDPCLVSNGASKLNMADGEHVEVENTRKASKVGGCGGKGETGFVFGNVQSGKGLLKKPNVGLTSVQFGPSLFYRTNSVWSSHNSGVKAMKSDGDSSRRIAISVDDIKKGSEACALQLYGYFVGTSMDYRVVNANLSRMWRVHGIVEITKTSAGLFYFKFNNEEGMKAVLESGPWMVNNIPLVLNVWEPGIWLDKVEPSTIPIWVCVYGIPMELCNGNGIGKIFSGIRKPKLMDKLTRERCLKKSGKLDFARVLVEVSATDDLPNVLEIEYPQIGERPARVGKLEKSCGNVSAKGNDRVDGDDGFVAVGRRNKPVVNQNYSKQFGMKNRNGYGDFKQNFGSQGVFQQNRVGNQRYQVVGMKNKVKGDSSNNVGKEGLNGNSGLRNDNSKKGGLPDVSKKDGLVIKPPLSSKYNANFKPKVLVRGSGSNVKAQGDVNENVPVANSFQAFEDHDMVDKEEMFNDSFNEEYEKSVWPKLRKDVEDVLKSGVYLSLAVRSDWSLSQLDFFYKNCSSYGMQPYVDEEDVESENEGMADVMKPDVVNNRASNESVNDEY
ncbi:hypothetical protein Tco_0322519 [Tanacetum coccineum]